MHIKIAAAEFACAFLQRPLEAAEDELAPRKKKTNKKKIFVHGAPRASRREIDHLRSTFLVIGAYESERCAARPWPLVPVFCRSTRPRSSKLFGPLCLAMLTIKSDVFSEPAVIFVCHRAIKSRCYKETSCISVTT